MKNANRYTSKVLEILPNGDAVIELPDKMCDELGWKIGDTLKITNEDGNIIIKKIDNDDRNKSSTDPCK